MIFNLKKTAVAATAIVCAVSMCGCTGDTGYMGTVEGNEIRNGVYLTYMMRAFNNGYTEVTDAKEELGDTSEVSDIFAETINGKTASEWIKEDTLNYVKRHIAVKNLFESKGLALTTEEINSISTEMNDTWDATELDYYGIGYMMPVSNIYGTDTMGEYYESVGIGLDSMKEIESAKLMEERLFTFLYDTDGESAVTDEAFNAYMAENYAVVKYMELPFTDKYGIELKDDAEVQAVKDKAQSYVDRINGGESYFDVRYEYDLAKAQDEAAVAAEEAFEKETYETPTEEEFDAAIEAAIAGATAEKYEVEADVETVITKEYSSLNEDLTEYIWSAPADNAAAIFETDTAMYVVVKHDITTKENWREAYRDDILHALCDDQFEELLKTTYASYTVDFDEKLVKKYAPETYKGFAKAE